MTDAKANIKIEFSIYGKDYKYDGWINWYPEEDDGIDERVREFFRTSFNEAYSEYQWDINEDQRKRDAKEAERKEREQYEYLKQKYEAKLP